MKTKFFYCSGSLRFISIEKACDGKADCSGGEDELNCVSRLRTNGTFPGKCARETDFVFSMCYFAFLDMCLWLTVSNIYISL